MFEFNINKLKWLNKPREVKISEKSLELTTLPNTDLWQKTYYGFERDNAHMFYVSTEEKYFTFTAKVEFETKVLFDQCGMVIYQDSNNWMKSGIEYHDEDNAWLGSVVTNQGYSDWATTNIGSFVKTMWYRISRRGSDFRLESSFDGIEYQQMRIFHLFSAENSINIGLMACSPTTGSFNVKFSDFTVTECLWELEDE